MSGAEQPDGTESAHQATAQAASWMAKLSAGELSDTERLELRDWLVSDVAHRRELRAMRAIWVGAPARESITAPKAEAAAPAKRRFGVVPLGAAAALLLALGTTLYFTYVPRFTTYATAVGEQRVITATDGSVVNLNTGSELDISITDQSRRARLRSGEAFFSVHRDTQRRFEVELGDAVITVLGTRFDVRREPAYFTVSVTEGVVRVATTGPGTSPESGVVTLNAGQRLTHRSSGETVVERFEAGGVPNWVSGKLRFDRTELATALAEANRYRRLPLVLQDAKLATVPVSGVFWIDRLDDMVTVLEAQGLVRARPATDGRSILLSAP